MEIKQSEKNDILIISILGDMKTPESNEVYEIVKKELASGRKKILVDLAQVKFMNSFGIGVLIRSYTSTKTAGGNLKLAAIDERVKGVLTVTNLNKVFEEYDTVDAALNDFE